MATADSQKEMELYILQRHINIFTSASIIENTLIVRYDQYTYSLRENWHEVRCFNDIWKDELAKGSIILLTQDHEQRLDDIVKNKELAPFYDLLCSYRSSTPNSSFQIIHQNNCSIVIEYTSSLSALEEIKNIKNNYNLPPEVSFKEFVIERQI